MQAKLLASVALFSILSLAQIKNVDQNLVFLYRVHTATHKPNIFDVGITNQRRRCRHPSEPNMDLRRQRRSIRSPRLRPRSSRKQPVRPLQSDRQRNHYPKLVQQHPHLSRWLVCNPRRPSHHSQRRFRRLHRLRGRPTRWLISSQRRLQRRSSERPIRLFNQSTWLSGSRCSFNTSMGC